MVLHKHFVRDNIYTTNKYVGYKIIGRGNMQLFKYQKNALVELEKRMIDFGKAVLVAPCGAGKTIIFCKMAHNYYSNLGNQSLIIVNNDELVQQTVEKLLMTSFKDNNIGIEKAENRVNRKYPVVVASLKSIMIQERLLRLLSYLPNLNLVIVDECHHAMAPETYRTIQQILSFFRKARLLGVSATPRRPDALEIDQLFGKPENTWVHISKDELIREGRIVPLQNTYLKLIDDSELQKLRTIQGDYVIFELSNIVNVTRINGAIISAVQERNAIPGVIYCCSVQHAKDLTEMLREKGITCELLTGTTPKDERREIIRRFGKDLNCIVNVMVLTEGYDAPKMRYLILARPTKSAVLYEQIIGRAARSDVDKTEAEIIHLTSPRSVINIKRRQMQVKQKNAEKQEKVGENLVLAIIREVYIRTMLNSFSELDYYQVCLIAKDFSQMCAGSLIWLPLRKEGPLFTVVPCSSKYDGYRNAVFAIAGPSTCGKVSIIACKASKNGGPWKINPGFFGNIKMIQDAPVIALHSLVGLIVEDNNISRQWVNGDIQVPHTIFRNISKKLPKPPKYNNARQEKIEYVMLMSAAAEAFFKSLFSGSLFLRRKFKTATSISLPKDW